MQMFVLIEVSKFALLSEVGMHISYFTYIYSTQHTSARNVMPESPAFIKWKSVAGRVGGIYQTDC